MSNNGTGNSNINSRIYSQWLNEWLVYVKPQVKKSTFIRYKNIVDNHLQPHLGKLVLPEITTGYLKKYICMMLTNGRLDKGGGLLPKTVSDILMIIKESFDYIRSFGEKNDCNFKALRIKNSPKKEIQVLSVEEEHKLTNTRKGVDVEYIPTAKSA